MKTYQLSARDLQENFFHFTRAANLSSIQTNGLLPQKGKHAKYIEQTEKVFFVQGLDNLLILFDCWINVYKKIPILPEMKLTHGLASKAMRAKHFPMCLVDGYFTVIKHSRRHQRYAYDAFDQILDNCILLQLNLTEGQDFRWSDTDEIKAQNYRKRHLIELGYAEQYSDLSSNCMDKWNLHTLSGHGVSPNQISECRLDQSTNLRDIINYAVQHTKLNLAEICPVLTNYLATRTQK